MRDGGRISATIEVLDDFESRRVPIKVCLADWARGARYAGSKDRAFVSGLALEALRHRASLTTCGGGYRLGVALVLRHHWEWPQERIRIAYEEAPHGPGALTAQDIALVESGAAAPMDPAAQAEVPEFVFPLLGRVSDDPIAEGQALCQRAPVDLRVNTLKADAEKALAALSLYHAVPTPFTRDAIRVPAPPADKRAPDVTATPAYAKGWVEVQDEGSQLAALAAGRVEGKQVLDFCAGGGGKTLALAALMDNRGQIYAYDSDAKRLAPIFDRLKRAGVRNAQVLSPAESEAPLKGLEGQMDLVFVDAPCSGSGTWRRRPDTKWRLTEAQLAARIEEQDEVLAAAAAYVKPGGTLIYVTCSLFAEENEDRISHFLKENNDFTPVDPVAAMAETGRCGGIGDLTPWVQNGTLYLTPRRGGTDGFGITRLHRR